MKVMAGMLGDGMHAVARKLLALATLRERVRG